ncbi:3',5'-cyclic AMP phosphodiesterase CpdA [Frondihabitans sp. PhB188]|uniref:phosphodiesterase n=1 Tax=Frondihabitans sp. PhB188 TaxID=2485200 RepID=UPI000F485311|nr:phosphodiesterase [Frondihabitans sp. PhB188]ROQ41244.1 3',5'-cyclic AMP phosphodiesterase CpdA [Frondihabitans sp. PhB188]
MGLRTAEHARPDHFILHLSDTHLIEADSDLYGDVDSASRLRQILAELEDSGARPEAIVVTGDLADKGEPGAYRKLRALMEPVALRLGAQIIWAMGNHDDRGAFRSELFGQIPSDRPVDFVYDVNGLRIITLDTTVPGHHYGELTGAQLDWLAEELSVSAPDGTILAMHHPPVPSIKDLTVLVELRDQASLAEVVEGSDVRSIIAGHLHFSTNAMFAGIPVSVASATCYTADLNIPTGATRGQDGAQSYNLMHVYPETIVSSVVPIGSYRTVGEYVGPEQVAARLAEAGVVIPAARPRHRAEPDVLTVPTRDLSLTGPIGTL